LRFRLLSHWVSKQLSKKHNRHGMPTPGGDAGGIV
jgi:hypothetical protein